MPVSPHIETLPFSSDDGLGTTARLGMIILQSDQTIEHEAAQLIHPHGATSQIALYHSRIPNDTEVNEDSLRQMSLELPQAASLLPSRFAFDAIGYGCTSGATMIGEAEVERLIKTIHPDARITNPITACKAALAKLGIKRLALLTPYAVPVTQAMQDNLQDAGYEITSIATFNQSDDFKVARISSQSIYEAVMSVGKQADCDAVFVSCTSLRALPIIAEAERALQKPVLSSNQVFIWHLMRLAGLPNCPDNAGHLFEA